MRKITIITLCISIFTLVACQQNEIFNDETITSIEIQAWESGEEMNAITDESLIHDLIAELESANSASTANLDMPNPDCHLLFLSDESLVKELGYYIEENNFNGVTGRYIDMEEGEHYGVTTELPINDNSD